MMQTQSWKLAGGLNLTRDAITRHRAPGELIGCMNYESREEGYRRIDGYERFDGRKSPSNIFDDELGAEDAETEKRRALITAVPGTTLLAVWRYRDRTYAFSVGTDGAVTMHGSSSTGWQAIALGWSVAFTAGTGVVPEAGDSLTAAGSQIGTVIGYHLTSGAWADDDAAGVLVFSYTGTARFAANAMVNVESDANRHLTVSAVPTEQVFGPATGAAFRFLNYNFFGQGSLERMYGVSGVAQPFEFDGTMFLELETGVTGSFPTRVAAHQNHLVIGYPNGSSVYSGTGKPRSFAADDGAGEIAIGDTLTELIGGYRDTLFIFGRNKTAFLSGTSNQDFRLQVLSDEAGAMAGTAVLMDQPTVYDDRGLRNVTATDRFGDFSISTMSESIRPLLDFKRAGEALPVAAVRIRRKSQYRLFFSDGDCICLTYVRRGRSIVAEYTRLAYDLYDAAGLAEIGRLTSVCSVEDSDGRERVFATMRNSMFVYELDRGKSFDGRPINYYLRTSFNDFRAPHVIKRYRKILVEIDSVFESQFSLSADFDDGRLTGEQGLTKNVRGPGSFWDEEEWDAFYWNTVPVRSAGQRIRGRGRNISVALYSIPDRVEEAHIVTGLTVYFEPRRMQR